MRFGETTDKLAMIDAADPTTGKTAAKTAAGVAPAGSPLEVLLVFLKLGVNCFGGPIAFAMSTRCRLRRDFGPITNTSYSAACAACRFLPRRGPSWAIQRAIT